ncbi:major facilitator superfamily domain-containing protein [Circinella umbellata]|nr:major facilitator superfamily domain-containing protein [Circinella umbellata]
MSQHHPLPITSISEPGITEDNCIQYTSNNNNSTQTIQNVEEKIKSNKKEVEIQLHQGMDSDIESINVKKSPLTTSEKPWYSIELINIHKKEHILDSRDYSMSKKSAILAIVALSATLGPATTSIYYPAVVDMQIGLNTTDTAINASLSIFVFITACFPLLWTTLSGRYGSRPIYLISFLICLVGNICCAVSINIAMFIASRAISAVGSSSMMGMGGGTIADIFEPHQRGRAFSYFTSGVLLGPAISPIIGGYLNQEFGWRSIFWFLSIFTLCVWLSILLILPETKRPSSVELKKASVNEKYKDANEEQASSPKRIENSNQEKKKITLSAILGPLRFFCFPNITLITLSTGVMYLVFYIINANFARIYTYQYGLNSGKVGFCYVGMALGTMISSIVGGSFVDKAYKKQVEKTKNKEEIETEMRLTNPILYASIITLFISFTVFGWCIQANVHYAAGLVCIFFLGFALIIPNIITATYIMDCFPRQSSSVLGKHVATWCVLLWVV